MKLILSALVLAGSIQAAQLSSLVSSADAIVVGAQSGATQAGTTVTFILNVERVFSGSLRPGSNVTVTWVKANTGLPDGVPAQHGIWFLKQASNGNWMCLPAAGTGAVTFFPELSLPVSGTPLPSALAYDPASTALTDQIILETAAGGVRSNPRLILDLTADMTSPVTLRALRYVATSSSGDQMLAGIAGLVRAGDTGGLSAAEHLSASLTEGSPGADLVASSVGLNYRNTDPAGIATLGRMAASNEASRLCQKAAAQALAAIHSPASVSWLGLLLESSSVEMQVYGAQGLSYFVNGVGIATAATMPQLEHLNRRQPSAYRTDETDEYIGFKTGQPGSFVQYWRAWWGQHPALHTLVAQ